MSVASTITAIETDAVSVLSALPSLSGLVSDFSTLAQGITTGEGGIAKVGTTANNLAALIAGLFTTYATFHATQAAIAATAPPSN